jgi:transcriptional regulator with XRE-family HTH domain
MQRVRKADGETLRTLRDDAWLSQQELADLAGVARATVNYIECGHNTHPRSATIKRLAEALGVRPEALIEEVAEAPSKENGSPLGIIQSLREEIPARVEFGLRHVDGGKVGEAAFDRP